MDQKILVYDCEIAKCIPDGQLDSKYSYCKGWSDFSGMGIACICTYASWLDRYGAFTLETLPEFALLVLESDQLIGFNSLSFDDRLLAANGILVETSYDLLCEVRLASGQPAFYTPGLTRGGYNLDALAAANLGRSKTGSGALAPKLWQDGKRQEVMNYCLNDVRLTWKLLQKRLELVDPTNHQILKLRDIPAKYTIRDYSYTS